MPAQGLFTRFAPVGSVASWKGDGQMKVRSLSFVSGLLLSAAVVGSILVTPAAARKPPKPPPPPPPAPTSFSTYVKSYADVIDGVKCDVTPQRCSQPPTAALSRSQP